MKIREMRPMIPLDLKLAGVRAFGNHVVNLGGPEVREVIMFGPNGSGKSTIARMIQALVGDAPDDLQRSFLDERDSRVNKRASVEMTVLNRKGDELWNPDWPETVTLGLEFGYENNRAFSRYYTVMNGKRQTYRTHEEYAAMFRRHPFSIKPDDRFMFIQQGESAALVQMRPRQRYETMKQFLGLEDLEKRWQDTLDAKERTGKELSEAASQHGILEEGLKRKEIAANRLREYRRLSEELKRTEQALAQDNLLRLVDRLRRVGHEEARLAASLLEEKKKRGSLEGELQGANEETERCAADSASFGALIAQARARQAKANQERAEARRLVEEREAAIGSLERIASEGLSEEDLERRAQEIREEIRALEKQIKEGEENREALSRSLDEERNRLADVRQSVQRMESELASAEELLRKNESSAELAAKVDSARADLAARREAAYAAETRLQECERALRTLEANETAMPPEAIAARDEYLAQGVDAVILGDAVAPRSGLSRDELVSIEGALGDLRWAVLLGDGRVLVDYPEYTIARTDFLPVEGVAAEGAGAEGAGGEGAGAEGDVRPEAATTCASLLVPSGDLPPSLSTLLDEVLRTLVFAGGHESAAALGRTGLVAYTSDGYRYDRYGRRYSVPERLCVGRTAYEMALSEARNALTFAQEGSKKAAQARAQAEEVVARLEDTLRQVKDAEERVQSLRTALPEVRAEQSRFEKECERVQSGLETLLAELTELRVQLGLRRNDIREVEAKIERVRKLGELPRMRQELVEARHREAEARRVAEEALEEARRHEAAKEAADQRVSALRFDIQRYEERLEDLVPRIDDIESRLEEKRQELREIHASVPFVADEWRAAMGKAELGDQEVLTVGQAMLDTSSLASEGQRISWRSKISEIRPTVDALKDEVIETAEEDYLSAKTEFDRAEEELRRVGEAFGEASSREAAAQDNFKKVMQETFGRVSSRFQGYLSKFGWTGYLSVEPVQGTQFDLQIYLSVYEGTEPRPLMRNRSGGETSAVAALLTLAMVKEYRRPFYIFDEIDQSLDPANVLKLGSILRQELGRKYIVISHRLNRSHLEQGQFGIGVYRSQCEGSRTRVYQRKDAVRDGSATP
jgi:chromosome segregation ATPase